MEKQYKYEVKKEKNGNIIVTVDIEFTYFQDERDKVLKELGKNVEIKGFRKGQVPESALEGQYGPQANLQVVRQVAFEVVKEITKKQNEPVLSPLTVKEISDYEIGKDIKFKFVFLGSPDIDLKKLKKVKVENAAKADVKDEEVEKVIEEMWTEDNKATKEELTKGTGKGETTLLGPDGKPIKSVKQKKENEEKFDMRKVSNDWAKKIDPSVSTLGELKKKIKGALESRKQQYNDALYEHSLFDAIAKELEIEIPKDLVESEMINREEEFYRMARMSGASPAEYVKSQGLSIEQLRENWKNQVENGIKQLLIISGIANAADLNVKDSEAEKAKQEGEKLEGARMRLLKNRVIEYLGKMN